MSDDDFAIKSKYHKLIFALACFNPYCEFQDANLWTSLYSIIFKLSANIGFVQKSF